MQTMREIMGRTEEQLNLRRIGFCYLVVIFLVVLAFGVTYLDFSQKDPLTTEAPVATGDPD